MNSVVPMANPPSASASNAAPTWVRRTARAGAVVIVSVTTPSSTRQTERYSTAGDNGDVRLIDDDERRARLGRRHALATPVTSVEDAARAVVALHGTDPATTVLSAVLRSDAAIEDVQRALYEERSLVRVLAMRRTVFAVPTDLVTTAWAGASDVVAREQRRVLGKMLLDSAVTNDPDPWIAQAESAARAFFEENPRVSSADLSASHPSLATRLDAGMSVASRLLTLLSAEGAIVRAQPRGGWTSTQFRWATAEAWCGDLGERPGVDVAAAELARRWLHAYGPAHEDDVQWWFGWTKTRTRAALAALDLVDVQLQDRTGIVLADDVDEVSAPDPWVALLPALDPSTMGWKHRDFVLGSHRGELFDVNGNGGPTVWVDGQIVGGWTHRDDGEVAVEVFDDVGREATEQVAAKAAALSELLGDVRLKARARGWTPSENRLRA